MKAYRIAALCVVAVLLSVSMAFAADPEAAGAAPDNEAAAEAPGTQVLVTVTCGPKSPCNAKKLILIATKAISSHHGFIPVTAGDLKQMTKPGDKRSAVEQARAMGIVNHLHIKVMAGKKGLAALSVTLDTGVDGGIPRLMHDGAVRARGGDGSFVKKAIDALLKDYADLTGRRFPLKLYGAVDMSGAAKKLQASLTNLAGQAIQEAAGIEVLTLTDLRTKLPAKFQGELATCEVYPCQVVLAASFGVTDILDISVKKGTRRGMVSVEASYRSGSQITARVRIPAGKKTKNMTKAIYRALEIMFTKQ